MTTHSDDTAGRVNEFRMVARGVAILALLTGLIYVYPIVAGGVFAPSTEVSAGQTLLLLLFLGAACAGLLLAWRREGSGGLLAIASGFVFGALVYRFSSHDSLTSGLFYGSPFVLSGALFLASWWRGRDEISWSRD